MSELHLACASDEAYVEHSAAMIHSALANRGAGDLRIHYLCSPGFDPEPLDALGAMVEGEGGSLSVHRIPDEWVAGMPSWEYIGASMWFRIFLPELLADAGRVLYLDVDTIVAGPLEPLWAADLGDAYLGAVTNVFPNRRADHVRRLGLTEADYFNSGVLLMNLEQMRVDGSTAELAAFARGRAAEVRWPDQDALNMVLGGRRMSLHPRWNTMNALHIYPWADEVFGADRAEEARREPGIRHFEGPSLNKPWNYLCLRPDRDLYFEHRRRTPWPDVEIEDRTPGNVLRRLWRRGKAALRT